MSLGARLCLNSDEDKESFKNAINRNTTVGSFIDSGDHLRDEIKPMCDYDTQSVINVLSQELLIKKDVAFSDTVTTDKKEYYKEVWR